MNRSSFRMVVVTVLFGIAVLPLCAGNLEVTYVEGLLQVKQGSAWVDLEIGETVADTATLQFDGMGVAELAGAGTTVTLRQRGTYQLSDIVAKSKEVASTGLGSMVKGRVAGVLQGTKKADSAVMGVRAADASETTEEVGWLGSSTDLMEQAMEDLQNGDYEPALDALTEAFEYSDESEEPEILFYTAYACVMLDRGAQALDAISGVTMTPKDALYGDFLLLRGQLLVDALAFKDAYGSFDSYRTAMPAGSSVQLANLMAGYCANQYGDKTEAKRSLEAARRADPASDLGKKAQELLGGL